MESYFICIYQTDLGQQQKLPKYYIISSRIHICQDIDWTE